MPNWCHNTVIVSCSNETILTDLRTIFEGDNLFATLIPEPQWDAIPLNYLTYKRDGKKIGEVGEIPVQLEDQDEKFLVFESTGEPDMRWYDWREIHWQTKWDACRKTVVIRSATEFAAFFETAWAPSEPVHRLLEEAFPEADIHWKFVCAEGGFEGTMHSGETVVTDIDFDAWEEDGEVCGGGAATQNASPYA